MDWFKLVWLALVLQYLDFKVILDDIFNSSEVLLTFVEQLFDFQSIFVFQYSTQIFQLVLLYSFFLELPHSIFVALFC